MLALRVSPANEDDRDEVTKLSEEIQRATGENVELAYVEQGYTGERASGFAAEHGIRLEVVKYEEAKHGSWLNMAEIELSVLSCQCLNRRAPDFETLSAVAHAWQEGRDQKGVRIDWRFSTDDARIKLKRLYPSLQE